MPRTLPWLTNAAKGKVSNNNEAASTPASKRGIDNSDEEDLVDDDLNVIRPSTPERRPKKRANRTPSTSPPPAPPSVKYMREGYNADDIYLMVEDEFLSTAKMYTQHIHHAEYVRLKKLAKSRGAGTLRDIHRPTDGRTKQSHAFRMQLEAEEKDRKIKDGVKKLGDDDESSEAEDEYMYDPQLAGLMTRDNPVRRDLSNISKAKSNTRAAAGFGRSSQNAERKEDALVVDDDKFSDDTDDLDNPPPVRSKPSLSNSEARHTVPRNESRKIHDTKLKPVMESSRIFKRFTKPSADDDRDNEAHVRCASPPKVKKASETSPTQSRTIDTGDNGTSHTSTREYLSKRRLERERKEREEKRKAKKADDIPTFLL